MSLKLLSYNYLMAYRNPIKHQIWPNKVIAIGFSSLFILPLQALPVTHCNFSHYTGVSFWKGLELLSSVPQFLHLVSCFWRNTLFLIWKVKVSEQVFQICFYQVLLYNFNTKGRCTIYHGFMTKSFKDHFSFLQIKRIVHP